MTNGAPSGIANLQIEARIENCELKLSVDVPTGPTSLDDMFPLLQILSDKIVETAEKEANHYGHAVSCRKGCGACCRQLVPISPVEARHIARLVAQMPEPRRQEIVRRFAAAKARLQEAGLWDSLSRRQGVTPLPIGMQYFRLGIPCPFLEDECCSIHQERPLTCREFLVVTPAENCANPTPQTVRSLRLAASVWVTAARCETPADAEYANWVPLVRSLEWAQEQESPPPVHTGPELVRLILENLPGSHQDDDSPELSPASISPPVKPNST
jgi:Fe-S-cluster containining protein